jgi:hypothetical protein
MIISHESPTKNKRYNAQRDSQIQSGFTWAGSTFQIDPSSILVIAGRAVKIIKRQLLEEAVPDFYWRTLDDQFYVFTATEFLEFADAVDAHVESIYAESWAGKDN